MHDFLSILDTIFIRAVISSLVTGLLFAVLRLFMRNIKLLLIVLGVVWLILIGVIPITFISGFK